MTDRQQGVLWKRRDVFKYRWRPRWFVLHPEQGVLTYYLLTANVAQGLASPTSTTPASHYNARARTFSLDSQVSENTVDYDVVPRGTLDLRGGSITVQANERLSKPDDHFFAFTISAANSSATSSAPAIHLAARTPQGRRVWMERIRSVIQNPCKSCSGAGRIEKDRSLSVNIPAGVETGTRIRLAGEGEAGLRGGPAGDLYIFIEVAEHPLFQRDGTVLFCRVPVSMTSAAIGGDIEVPTIDGGRSRVKIPAGSQSGRQMRLRGKGMPSLRGGSTGDMLIELAVETPVNLTAKQKDLLLEFAKLSEENNPESSGFLKKMKSFWESMKS